MQKNVRSRLFRDSKRLFCLCLIGFILSSAAGCSGFGANAMHNSRAEYNTALQRSNDQQLLANIVSLRYAQSPSFLEIDGITAQFSINAEASAGVEHEREDASRLTRTDLFSLGGSIGYSSDPTITFTPLRGEAFLEQFLSPIELKKIMLLYNSGWTLKRLFRLTVQSINGIPNAKRASGPISENPPAFQKFEEVIDLMRDLEKQNLLEFMYETYDDKTEISLVLKKEAWSLNETVRMADLLGIVSGKTHYDVIYRSFRADEKARRQAIMLETRSLLGVLFFLSHSVAVPDQDLAENIVRVTRQANGAPFDWSKVLHDAFSVKSSQNPPASPAVAVKYRNNWFYINENDISSKATLMLVSQLFALQSGSAEHVTPILTLPVGRK